MLVSPPKFDRTVSLGNLLSILAVVVAGVSGYATLKADVGALTSHITRMEQARADLEVRVRAMEVVQARQASDTEAIRQGIIEIKETLWRLEERVAQ